MGLLDIFFGASPRKKKIKYKILFIGPQASGKGTQAEILSQKLGVPIFSTGNILRQKIAGGDELGNKLAAIINSGQLVSDDLVNEIIAAKIATDGRNGYILDGYPRNMAQAKFLDLSDQLTQVFEVYITDDEALSRISGRRTCPKCQTVYHIEYNPPQKENICDKDGAELVIREDEKPESVKERLRNYHEQTEPLLKFYQEKGIYHKINGEQSIAAVSKEILKIL